jgi:hypothetical protein
LDIDAYATKAKAKLLALMSFPYASTCTPFTRRHASPYANAQGCIFALYFDRKANKANILVCLPVSDCGHPRPRDHLAQPEWSCPQQALANYGADFEPPRTCWRARDTAGRSGLVENGLPCMTVPQPWNLAKSVCLLLLLSIALSSSWILRADHHLYCLTEYDGVGDLATIIHFNHILRPIYHPQSDQKAYHFKPSKKNNSSQE